ncbi:MAG: DsbE family thiol:disulfide interchange protein [Pelagibacterales bacterium]|nr:DsbE family thiol:disulfide interchange protein [Pelagibacterales bacterium]
MVDYILLKNQKINIMKLLKYTPLILFFIVSIFLYNKIKFQKELEPISSALIQKNFPKLEMYSFKNNQNINEYIENRPVVINIFASWCAPCRIEHEVLTNFSKDYEIVGIAYKDSEENIKKFLKELGNPYKNIFYDFSGKESIHLGLYGVPETFFVNKENKVIYKHVGPINNEDFQNIAPMIFK